MWLPAILFRYEFYSSLNFFYRQTDRQTDGQKVTPMSPPYNMHRWAQKAFPQVFLISPIPQQLTKFNVLKYMFDIYMLNIKHTELIMCM